MKHSDIRQHIVKTASSLFYKNGYNLTGINEIISEAGIAKATLYSHFRSKEDICIAYLQYRNDAFLRELGMYCTAKPKGQKQLVAIFDFLKLFYKEKEFNGCWCIKTVAEIPKDNETIRHQIQSQKKAFLALIESLITSNYTNKAKKEVTALSRQIYLLYEGAVSESHLLQSAWPIDSAKLLCQKIMN